MLPHRPTTVLAKLRRVNSATRHTMRDWAKRVLKPTTAASAQNIMLEVTNHCNLSCVTCPLQYRFGREMAKGFMDITKLKRVIDEVAPHIRSIGLTGLGETLLYPHLAEAVDYIRAKTRDVHIFISTNAHLPRIESLIAPLSGKLSAVQISIDGVGATYNAVRIRGDWDTFIGNVRQIVALAQADVMFNMVAFQQNYTQMAEVVTVAAQLGVKHVHINTMNLVSTPERNPAEYAVYLTDAFRGELRRAHAVARELGVQFTTFDFATQPGFQKCSFPWKDFYVSWDGFLVPCCAKPFPKLLHFGNVFDNGLMRCVNSPAFRKFRKQWYANDTPGFCKCCHIVDIPRVDPS